MRRELRLGTKGKDAPCKDCTKRGIGCHSTCEDYVAYRTGRDRQLAEELKEKEVVYQRIDMRSKQIIRYNKCRRK